MELQRAKVKATPAIKGKGSIASGIQQVKTFKLFVTKRSTHMMDELDNYKWVKDELNDTYTNVPIDAWNHSLDAMRYGVDYLLRKYRPKAFMQ